jgi:hypothetical protein
MTETKPPNQFFDLIKKLNIYDEDESLSLLDQSLSTRILISLMITSFTIIIIFTGINLQTNTVTILYPSEKIFKNLSDCYSNTLSCVCKQSSIRQDKIISFNLQFHPICTSQFINRTFILSLFDMNVSDYWPLDYRGMVAFHFQLIALFCQHMKQNVFVVIEEFDSKYLITTQTFMSGLIRDSNINAHSAI